MKIKQTAEIEYDEVDLNFQLKLSVLFQRFQRAALFHSEKVGMGPQAMIQNGGVWILNRMMVDIHRMPVYREKITVETWHKGRSGVKTGRAFVLSCGDETVCVAESQWLYFDLRKKRIVKIPEVVLDAYTTEREDALDKGAIDFSVDRKFEPEQMLSVSTRDGDYDSNGHVNNTVYLDYLSTLIKREKLGSGRLNRIGIQYRKEIGKEVHTINVGASADEKTVKFLIFSGPTVYAAGFFSPVER
jgi:medium-chain acyl-[acyl-carrier-protein] hydrolase